MTHVLEHLSLCLCFIFLKRASINIVFVLIPFGESGLFHFILRVWAAWHDSVLESKKPGFDPGSGHATEPLWALFVVSQPAEMALKDFSPSMSNASFPAPYRREDLRERIAYK